MRIASNLLTFNPRPSNLPSQPSGSRTFRSPTHQTLLLLQCPLGSWVFHHGAAAKGHLSGVAHPPPRYMIVATDTQMGCMVWAALRNSKSRCMTPIGSHDSFPALPLNGAPKRPQMSRHCTQNRNHLQIRTIQKPKRRVLVDNGGFRNSDGFEYGPRSHAARAIAMQMGTEGNQKGIGEHLRGIEWPHCAGFHRSRPLVGINGCRLTSSAGGGRQGGGRAHEEEHVFSWECSWEVAMAETMALEVEWCAGEERVMSTPAPKWRRRCGWALVVIFLYWRLRSRLKSPWKKQPECLPLF